MVNIMKNKKKIIRSVMIVGLLLVVFFSYGIYWAFFDVNRLPTGEYLTEETYTLKAYLSNGGATTSYSIRGELVFNNLKGKTKNIYWNNREESASIKWLDSDTVNINGHSLDVPDEKFDFRNQ